MRFRVCAPASSANLGPGFDALGLALDLWNELEIDTEGPPGITVEGSEAAHLDPLANNYTLNAMQELASAYGKTLPACAMRVRAEIPVARGLGSSAAALVAGLLAADRLLDLRLPLAEMYRHAWAMEGHGDNVGAALYGGAILSVAGVPEAIRLTDGRALGLAVVLFIPEATSATWAARAALPATVPHPDAAFNVGAAAGLAVGLMTGNRAAIAAGMHDRLHEPYRARLFPHLATDGGGSAGSRSPWRLPERGRANHPGAGRAGAWQCASGGGIPGRRPCALRARPRRHPLPHVPGRLHH
ncbi:MAG: homoserine kinase [Thermomicrobiales bacterium]|nr:MAG: homoserine kinase [Thermomicrobiales bacterium]